MFILLGGGDFSDCCERSRRSREPARRDGSWDHAPEKFKFRKSKNTFLAILVENIIIIEMKRKGHIQTFSGVSMHVKKYNTMALILFSSLNGAVWDWSQMETGYLAIVTGGAQGIGRAIAFSLLAAGGKVSVKAK